MFQDIARTQQTDIRILKVLSEITLRHRNQREYRFTVSYNRNHRSVIMYVFQVVARTPRNCVVQSNYSTFNSNNNELSPTFPFPLVFSFFFYTSKTHCFFSALRKNRFQHLVVAQSVD